LRAGIAAPVIYFGSQLLAAPFYPGYSFLARDASTLGSEGSTFPAVFNAGSILCGGALLAAGWGFLHALRRRAVPGPVSWLVFLALVAGGTGSVNAGVHPLPDPRHTSGLFAFVGAGLFLVPVLLPVAVWRLPRTRALRIYLILNLLVLLLLAPVMSGLLQRWSMMAGVTIPGLQDFLNHDQGLLQRFAAATAFIPIGVSAALLTRLPAQSAA
jgi:hypothetical membrane protein